MGKLTVVFPAILVLTIHLSVGLDWNVSWYFMVAIALYVIFIDAMALPIEHVNDGIKFHHLWRISTLNNNSILFISSDPGSIFQFRKEKEVGIFVIKKPCLLYFFACDQENNLEQYYYDLGLIEKFNKTSLKDEE